MGRKKEGERKEKVHPADAYVDPKASRSSSDQAIPERGSPVPEERQQRHYSDLVDLDEADRQSVIFDKHQSLEFGHTLEDQIGGQLDGGFVITGFYEDRCHEVEADPVSNYLPTLIATRAVKAQPAITRREA